MEKSKYHVLVLTMNCITLITALLAHYIYKQHCVVKIISFTISKTIYCFIILHQKPGNPVTNKFYSITSGSVTMKYDLKAPYFSESYYLSFAYSFVFMICLVHEFFKRSVVITFRKFYTEQEHRRAQPCSWE